MWRKLYHDYVFIKVKSYWELQVTLDKIIDTQFFMHHSEL